MTLIAGIMALSLWMTWDGVVWSREWVERPTIPGWEEKSPSAEIAGWQSTRTMFGRALFGPKTKWEYWHLDNGFLATQGHTDSSGTMIATWEPSGTFGGVSIQASSSFHGQASGWKELGWEFEDPQKNQTESTSPWTVTNTDLDQ